MNIFDGLEKLISEHGSAAIISERLALARDQFTDLERKASELERQIGKLEAKLEREQLDHKEAQQELQRLQKEHEEETVIHSFLEFRRGKRTQNKWMPFCPTCHKPAGLDAFSNPPFLYCTGECAKSAEFIANLPPGTTLESIIKQLPQ